MKSSLQQKALVVIIGFCLLALLSIGSSIWFALITESDAAAINIAGSLRMQSWRLTEQVLIPELTSQEALTRLIAIYDNSINSDPLARLMDRQDALGSAYRSVLAQWHDQMKPLLADSAGYETFIHQVPGFVDHIDAMVKALQLNTEEKLQQLFITAILTLLGILSIGLVAIRFIARHLLQPISELGIAARRVRNGDFKSLFLPYDVNNEMGHLTQTFQSMAIDLGRLYDDLEIQVIEQTQALAQSNKALELLYNASRRLAANPYDGELVASMVEDWKRLLGLESSYICLSDAADSLRFQLINPESEEFPCEGRNCANCLKSVDPLPFARTSSWQFELLAKQQSFGFLKVSIVPGCEFSDESQQWLQTFADIVATSLYQSGAKTRERRILLMEERAVIARELHDSLAQALSYQKIQVVRLRRQLDKAGALPLVTDVVNELHEGISSAYTQLRELLRTFRLTLIDGDLEKALKQTIDEYCQRAPNIRFSLDYQLRYCSIDAHDQIHALQIVREALMNVVMHANARQAAVRCFQTASGSVVIVVEDDGCGIQDNPVASGHYGTTIMRERAASMGGMLDIRKSSSGGTEIYLEFRRRIT